MFFFINSSSSKVKSVKFNSKLKKIATAQFVCLRLNFLSRVVQYDAMIIQKQLKRIYMYTYQTFEPIGPAGVTLLWYHRNLRSKPIIFSCFFSSDGSLSKKQFDFCLLFRRYALHARETDVHVIVTLPNISWTRQWENSIRPKLKSVPKLTASFTTQRVDGCSDIFAESVTVCTSSRFELSNSWAAVA